MISSFETCNSCDGQTAALNDDPNPVYHYGYATEYVGDRANDDNGWVKVPAGTPTRGVAGRVRQSVLQVRRKSA